MSKRTHKKLSFLFSFLDVHTLEVIQKSFYSTIVKVSGMIFGLGVSIFLGRTIGADGLGIINLASRIVGITMIIALLGIPSVIVKEVAIAHNRRDFKHIGNVMYTAYWLNGGITFLISILFILISPWLANIVFREPRLTFPLVIAFLVITPQVFSRLFSSALIGFRKIWQSNLVDQTLSVVVVAILLFLAHILGKQITINLTVLFYAGGRVTVSVIMALYWRKLYNSATKSKFNPRTLLKTSIPLMFASAALVISSSIDSVMLGWLSNTEQIGLFSVALKLALLTSFFMQVTISSLSPKIAALFEKKKMLELRLMVKRVTKGLSIIGFFILLAMILFGKFALSLWGEEFKKAYSILIILTSGQLFNIASGPVGNLLIMTGYEKILRNITFVTLGLNILLNYFLILSLDAIGAAIATATTVAINMIISSYFVFKKIGFVPISFF